MESLGRVWVPAGLLLSLYKECGYHQDEFEVSRKSLGTSRVTMKPYERV